MLVLLPHHGQPLALDRALVQMHAPDFVAAHYLVPVAAHALVPVAAHSLVFAIRYTPAHTLVRLGHLPCMHTGTHSF